MLQTPYRSGRKVAGSSSLWRRVCCFLRISTNLFQIARKLSANNQTLQESAFTECGRRLAPAGAYISRLFCQGLTGRDLQPSRFASFHPAVCRSAFLPLMNVSRVCKNMQHKVRKVCKDGLPRRHCAAPRYGSVFKKSIDFSEERRACDHGRLSSQPIRSRLLSISGPFWCPILGPFM